MCVYIMYFIETGTISLYHRYSPKTQSLCCLIVYHVNNHDGV